MATPSAAPSTSPDPAIVVVGHGPLATMIAATLAGQISAGGAPVTHLVTPSAADVPAAPLVCPVKELAALPERPDYPQAAPVQHEGTPAALARQGENILVTLADGTTLVASQLVLASSHYAGKLLPSLGLALPLRPARAHRLVFNGATLPAPQSENLGYGTALAWTEENTTELIYDGLADPAQATFEITPDPRVIGALTQWLAPHLPTPAGAPLAPPQASVQRLATTPDYLPALGPWPGIPGLWLAVGLAGWGPALAPALAALFTTTFRGQNWPAALAFVSPARFRDGEANPVPRPQWLVERQPVVIGPQFATTVRMTGGRARRVGTDATVQLNGSELITNSDAEVQLTGSTLSPDIANTVSFKQGKTVTRAGDKDKDAPIGRPLAEKGKPRAAPTGFKR